MDRVWNQWYDEGVPISIDYPRKPLKDMFNYQAEENADRPYLILDDAKLSYKACNSMARSFANGLLSMHVRKGDRVVIMAPNVPQFVIVRQACYKIGAIVVPINPLSVVREITHYFNDSGVETAVVMAEFADKVIQVLRNQKTRLKRVIVFQVQGKTVELEKSDDILDFDTVIASNPDDEPNIKVEADDIAVLQYTGGTTGISKGCALSNYNLTAMACQTASWISPAAGGNEMRTLAAIPLYHVYGFNFNVNVNLLWGGSIVLVPKPTTDNLLEAINKHEPNLFAAVPTMLIGLNQHPDTPKSKVKEIKALFSGGAPLAVEALKTFKKISGIDIVEAYGLAEITNMITSNPIYTKRKAGSIGIPNPDVDIRIVDIDTGLEDMPPGETGELITQTPTLMQEYWENPDETKKVIRDGWLYTGDMAKMDEDGFIFLVDRKKDMILASGFNVYPREIDEVMYTHPKVFHSCTIGVPDPKRGETVKVFIVTKPGQTMSEQEVIDFCREQLTPYKVPRLVEFIDELPLTPVGKPDRKALRKLQN